MIRKIKKIFREKIEFGRNVRSQKNRIIAVLILFAVGINALQAGAVSKQQAQTVAKHFLHEQIPILRSQLTIRSIDKIIWDGLNDSLYLVQLQPQGFILMSADDQRKPVIAFSAESNFDVRVPAVKTLISRRLHAEQMVLSKYPALAERHKSQWATSGTATLLKVSGDSTYYFPTPVWGQGTVNGVYVFNLYTPNHWSAGCVATAMAEALAYYRWPIVGTGSHCYTENDAGQLCADFQNTYYDWPNMLDKYADVHSTPEERKAAGLLTYHTAVSVNMDFSANGSTSNVANAPYAFHHYFRLSGHYKAAGEANFWQELINNMKDARPAILAISRSDGFGHAIVADGYSERNGLFHLNMGWNGSDNGWYDIMGDWNVSGYNTVDGATKGLVPNPMINPQVQFISQTEFILSWQVSPKLHAQYFELQQAEASTGPWTTLAEAVSDTFYQISVPNISRYYYRVRARRDDIWWDWSAVQEVSLGGPRYLTFNVNMRYQTLTDRDSVVLRGNIPPLQGSINSAALKDADGDSIYSITLPFDIGYVGHELLYRFAIATPSGTQMESFNRSYTIGSAEYQNLDTVYFNDYTAIAQSPAIPEKTQLIGNAPNPFNPSTMIRYRLSRASRVQLSVYNILGERVADLLHGFQQAGNYQIKFRANNLPAGIYFCRLQAGSKTQVKKMILVR